MSIDTPSRAAHPLSRSRRRYLRVSVFALLIMAGMGFGLSRAVHDTAHPVTAITGDGVSGPLSMVWIPGGEFMMGSESKLAQPNERPAHPVRIHGFWMDRHHVTNAEFERFVLATRYVTINERKPDWETLRVQLPPGTPKPDDAALVPGGLVFVGTARPVDLQDYSQWWHFVPGASWRHPQGPDSSIAGLEDHPVVQVAFDDAQAYAQWTNKRLPTEAEWEFAARGGLTQASYAWGDDFKPSGRQMVNVWEGQHIQPFPVVNPAAGGAVGTSPVGTFPENTYGLSDMTGNAWQWVADWYRADAFTRLGPAVALNPKGPLDSFDPDEPGMPADAPKRVIRGGSFLCSEAYCLSYRPSARRGSDPYTGMSHLGFRLVSDAPPPTSPKQTIQAKDSP